MSALPELRAAPYLIADLIRIETAKLEGSMRHLLQAKRSLILFGLWFGDSKIPRDGPPVSRYWWRRPLSEALSASPSSESDQ